MKMKWSMKKHIEKEKQKEQRLKNKRRLLVFLFAVSSLEKGTFVTHSRMC